jgi:hypothetical protein
MFSTGSIADNDPSRSWSLSWASLADGFCCFEHGTKGGIHGFGVRKGVRWHRVDAPADHVDAPADHVDAFRRPAATCDRMLAHAEQANARVPAPSGARRDAVRRVCAAFELRDAPPFAYLQASRARRQGPRARRQGPRSRVTATDDALDFLELLARAFV